MIFVPGLFRAHSGSFLIFKIECDAFTNTEIELFADLILQMRPGPFSEVVGIPRGGLRLAAAIRDRVALAEYAPTLIVDDVLTTGRSMEAAAKACDSGMVYGAVIFARGPCPHWVMSVFSLNAQLR